jgi:hypothetical protein
LVGNLFSKKLNTTHKETLNLRERRSYSISNQEHQLTMSLSELGTYSYTSLWLCLNQIDQASIFVYYKLLKHIGYPSFIFSIFFIIDMIHLYDWTKNI